MNFKIRYTCEHDSSSLLRNSKADFTGREGDTPYGFYGGPRDLAQPRIQQADVKEGIVANICRIYKEETSEVKGILDKLTPHILLLKM